MYISSITLKLIFSLQVLVLGNKVDLPNAMRERDLIERMLVREQGEGRKEGGREVGKGGRRK